MSSIFPDSAFGGVVTRNAAGLAVALPAGAINVRVPPAAFKFTGGLPTAYDLTCTTRWSPPMMNAIVSEMVALAEAMTPTGTWNSSNLNNLAAAFAAWAAANAPNAADVGTTLTDNPATSALTYTNEVGAVTTARRVSADAGNLVTPGTDGGAFLNSSSIAGINVTDAFGTVIGKLIP